MKIAFFGASVTQQTVRHDNPKVITGYTQYLIKLLDSVDIDIEIFSYPSNTIEDAGVIYVSSVIESRPSFCFLEWSTPEYAFYHKDKVNYVLSSLIHAGVIPVILVLPRLDRLNSFTELTYNLKQLASEYTIPVIDLALEYLPDNSELRSMLRDYVHTNPKGGKQYAQHINEYIRNHLMTDNISFPNLLAYPENKNNIYIIQIDGSKLRPRLKNLSIKINSVQECVITIYAEQRLGPWSQYIHTFVSRPNEEFSPSPSFVHTLADAWTSRERQAIKALCSNLDLSSGSFNINLVASSQPQSICTDISPEIRIKGNLYIISNNANLVASLL